LQAVRFDPKIEQFTAYALREPVATV